MNEKIIITLWDEEQGVILPIKTGIFFENQSGGTTLRWGDKK